MCGIGQGLPPGPMIKRMGLGLPLDPMAPSQPLTRFCDPWCGLELSSGFCRQWLGQDPDIRVCGKWSIPQSGCTGGAGGRSQSVPVRPSANLTVPSLLLGSRVPSVSVASCVAPASMARVLNKGLCLGSMASSATLPSAARSMAQGLPRGSMLTGITPRPYCPALTGEGSTAPFPGIPCHQPGWSSSPGSQGSPPNVHNSAESLTVEPGPWGAA